MTAILTTPSSFNGADGAFPYAGLIADAAGDLFGTTKSGGADGDGAVFELVNNGGGAYAGHASQLQRRKRDQPVFRSDRGRRRRSLRYDRIRRGRRWHGVRAGNNGGGAYTPVTLLSFNGSNGAYPRAGLIADAAGDLFGTTYESAPYGDGTVFELGPVFSRGERMRIGRGTFCVSDRRGIAKSANV